MSRSIAREVTLKRLYAYYSGGECEYTAALQARFDEDDLTEKAFAADQKFSQALFDEVLHYDINLDERIAQHLKGWKIERVARVEHNILRIALLEMFYRDDTPVNIVINEAVELAKKYGSDRAAPFVNGVLGGAFKDLSEQRTTKNNLSENTDQTVNKSEDE